MTSNNVIIGTAATIYFGILGLFLYVGVWESKQPIEELKKCPVSRVEYSSGRSELGFSSGAHRIFIKGETKPVYLSENKDLITEGRLIDLKVRKGFPLFGEHLDGEILESE